MGRLLWYRRQAHGAGSPQIISRPVNRVWAGTLVIPQDCRPARDAPAAKCRRPESEWHGSDENIGTLPLPRHKAKNPQPRRPSERPPKENCGLRSLLRQRLPAAGPGRGGMSLIPDDKENVRMGAGGSP